MKTILSLLRHLVTGLAGIGTYLGTVGLVDPGSVGTANAFGAQLVEPLAGLLGLVAVVITRLLIAWAGKRFPGLTSLGKGGASGGMLPLLVMGLGMMAAFALPSCSPAQIATARAFPIRIGITGPDGAVSYSSKAGLEVSATVRATK